MIAFLQGELAAKGFTAAYICAGGVGFEVFMSGNALAQLPEVGQQVRVRTYLQVREDALVLYGFASDEEKALFEKLIAISGVGPKMAMAVLSYFTPSQLAMAVGNSDVGAMSKVPGVGKKTAQRIILEMKGSFDSVLPGIGGPAAADAAPAAASTALDAVHDALLGMGFTAKEAELALKGADADASEGALLQYALKKLGS